MAVAIADSILHDVFEADDVAEISMIKAWEKLEQLREVEKAGAWLFSIVYNTAVDHYRKKHSCRYVAVDLIEDIVTDKKTDPLKNIILSEYVDAAKRVLSDMNPIYSEILCLSVVESLGSAEIRNRLGISEKNRSVRLCRAKNEFRKKLSEMKETEDLFGEYMV